MDIILLKYKKLRQIALESPWNFVQWCNTKDEHDQLTPVKRFPRKDYIKYVLDTFETTPGIIFLPKSRQVMVTWLCCVYLLWAAKRFEYRLIFVQSKKERDAAVLVYDGGPEKNWDTARISFLESHLPAWLKDYPSATSSPPRITYNHNGSIIEGIPQGGAQIRSKTPSIVFSDEACFQPEFSDSYTAMLPVVKQGGQLIAVSSASPGFFGDICNKDQVKMIAA